MSDEVPAVKPEAGLDNPGATDAGADAGPETAGNDDQLNLKVTDNSTEVFFRVRPGTQLKRVMDQFCKRTGKDRKSLRFLCDGERVNDEDTPAALGLEDNDTIEVLNQQVGGC